MYLDTTEHTTEQAAKTACAESRKAVNAQSEPNYSSDCGGITKVGNKWRTCRKDGSAYYRIEFQEGNYDLCLTVEGGSKSRAISLYFPPSLQY